MIISLLVVGVTFAICPCRRRTCGLVDFNLKKNESDVNGSEVSMPTMHQRRQQHWHSKLIQLLLVLCADQPLLYLSLHSLPYLTEDASPITIMLEKKWRVVVLSCIIILWFLNQRWVTNSSSPSLICGRLPRSPINPSLPPRILFVKQIHDAVSVDVNIGSGLADSGDSGEKHPNHMETSCAGWDSSKLSRRKLSRRKSQHCSSPLAVLVARFI